jgi:hypothetical protein
MGSAPDRSLRISWTVLIATAFSNGQRTTDDGQLRNLPIINPAVPARTTREKYGGLFYLGIAGLAILIALVAWFACAFWRLRDVWADIYALHDAKRAEAERVEAALRLSRDDRVNDAQRMEMCLRRDLPLLARYLLAEAVSTEAVARDPRAFSLTVARSPEWPHWLRLLLARRLAYGAARGYAVPPEALAELSRHRDPMIGLWAKFALVVLPGSDSKAGATGDLERAARQPGDTGTLAAMLLAAQSSAPADQERRLGEATTWLRHHHPEAAQIWHGWEVRDGRLLRQPPGSSRVSNGTK